MMAPDFSRIEDAIAFLPLIALILWRNPGSLIASIYLISAWYAHEYALLMLGDSYQFGLQIYIIAQITSIAVVLWAFSYVFLVIHSRRVGYILGAVLVYSILTLFENWLILDKDIDLFASFFYNYSQSIMLAAAIWLNCEVFFDGMRPRNRGFRLLHRCRLFSYTDTANIGVNQA